MNDLLGPIKSRQAEAERQEAEGRQNPFASPPSSTEPALPRGASIIGTQPDSATTGGTLGPRTPLAIETAHGEESGEEPTPPQAGWTNWLFAGTRWGAFGGGAAGGGAGRVAKPANKPVPLTLRRSEDTTRAAVPAAEPPGTADIELGLGPGQGPAAPSAGPGGGGLASDSFSRRRDRIGPTSAPPAGIGLGPVAYAGRPPAAAAPTGGARGGGGGAGLPPRGASEPSAPLAVQPAQGKEPQGLSGGGGGGDEGNGGSQGSGDGLDFAEEEAVIQRDTEAFHREVNSIRADLKTLRGELLIVRQKHDACVSSADAREAQELRDEIRDEIARVSATALLVKRRLQALQDSTRELKDDLRLAQLFPAHLRMRDSIVLQLQARLRDVTKEFSEFREVVQRDYREAVQRRLTAITGTPPEETEVDRIVEAGEGDQVFRHAMLEAHTVGAEELLREARARHAAFLDLERSMLEVHQLYLDMATLVDAQGQTLDEIEAQVARATEYTVQGTKALRETKKLYKKTQRKKLIAIVCCVGILAAAATGIGVGIALK